MNTQVKIIPYLSFEGNCEEALLFYRDALGGELTIVNRYDNPAMQAPAAYQNKILHARLEFRGGALYASDVFPGQSAAKDSGNISISLIYSESLEDTGRIYKALAAGGREGHAFEKQFWGDWHGSLRDKYGVHWNVNFEEQAK